MSLLEPLLTRRILRALLAPLIGPPPVVVPVQPLSLGLSTEAGDRMVAS